MKRKIIGICICMLLCATLVSATQTGTIDRNEGIALSLIQGASSYCAWLFIDVFDIGATGATGVNGHAGAEYDGTFLYSTLWASNSIYRYDKTGTLHEEFSIPGVSGLRDLAFDGTYMYGGSAGSTIWQMDFTHKTLVNTFTGNFQCRAIAYNPDDDVFYVKNWGDPCWILDGTTFTILGTFNLYPIIDTYGLAYDKDGANKYLYIADQSGGNIIYQYDLIAGAYTGFSYDTGDDFGSGYGVAGGLWTAEDYEIGAMCLGGVVQDSSSPGVTDWLYVYIIHDLTPDLECRGSLGWNKVKPGDTVTGTFEVGNVGSAGSFLNWKVVSWPLWGTWTFAPDSGVGLAKGSWVTVTVTVVAPTEKNTNYTGIVKLVNNDDPSDFYEINVYVKTPTSLTGYFPLFFDKLFERFPNAFPLLRQLMGY
jgi:hypothetical protein